MTFFFHSSAGIFDYSEYFGCLCILFKCLSHYAYVKWIFHTVFLTGSKWIWELSSSSSWFARIFANLMDSLFCHLPFYGLPAPSKAMQRIGRPISWCLRRSWPSSMAETTDEYNVDRASQQLAALLDVKRGTWRLLLRRLWRLEVLLLQRDAAWGGAAASRTVDVLEDKILTFPVPIQQFRKNPLSTCPWTHALACVQ